MPVCNKCKKFSNVLTVDVCEHCGAKDWAESARPRGQSRVTKIIKDIWRGFWFILLFILAAYYFNESSWYPREREIEVFFKAHQWIDGEIKTCYSDQSKPSTDGELTFISCGGIELNESHLFRVKFWGPIKADKSKVWKCERSQTGMTCRLSSFDASRTRDR
jgi:hypothetical protein